MTGSIIGWIRTEQLFLPQVAILLKKVHTWERRNNSQVNAEAKSNLKPSREDAVSFIGTWDYQIIKLGSFYRGYHNFKDSQMHKRELGSGSHCRMVKRCLRYSSKYPQVASRCTQAAHLCPGASSLLCRPQGAKLRWKAGGLQALIRIGNTWLVVRPTDA